MIKVECYRNAYTMVVVLKLATKYEESGDATNNQTVSDGNIQKQPPVSHHVQRMWAKRRDFRWKSLARASTFLILIRNPELSGSCAPRPILK